MRCMAVVIALVVWGALALPAATAAGLPRTVEEQAEWCGDLFVARVCEECGMGVPDSLTAGARTELVEGMRATLSAPLSLKELLGFAGRLTDDLPCSEGELPFELQLRAKVRASVGALKAYLTEDRPRFVQGGDVMGQLGALLEYLEECLEHELAGVVWDGRGAARTIGARVFAFAAWPMVSEVADPFSPWGKRVLSDREMAALEERASYWARDARERWGEYRAHRGYGLLGDDPELMVELGSKVATAAVVFVADVMHTYRQPGPWLTPDEEAVLREQIAAWREARRAAEEGGAQ